MSYPQDRVANLLSRRGVSYGSTVLIAEVGSTAHGISVDDPNNDDLDLTIVRFEEWPELVTGDPNRQSMMIRTQPDGVRSRMGDIDLNVYTVRKFAKLAAGGNPSILGAIFSPRQERKTLDFEQLARIVASKQASNAFLGYMRQQIDRWVGARGQRSVSRPELVEQFGYDTKYAAHTVRLGIQGVEYLTTGRFSMPILGAEDIKAIRRGEVTEREALALAHELEGSLQEALIASPLPEKPGDWRTWVNNVYAINWKL